MWIGVCFDIQTNSSWIIFLWTLHQLLSHTRDSTTNHPHCFQCGGDHTIQLWWVSFIWNSFCQSSGLATWFNWVINYDFLVWFPSNFHCFHHPGWSHYALHPYLMAASKAPKHDFAPAWLKIPNQESTVSSISCEDPNLWWIYQILISYPVVSDPCSFFWKYTQVRFLLSRTWGWQSYY